MRAHFILLCQTCSFTSLSHLLITLQPHRPPLCPWNNQALYQLMNCNLCMTCSLSRPHVADAYSFFRFQLNPTESSSVETQLRLFLLKASTFTLHSSPRIINEALSTPVRLSSSLENVTNRCHQLLALIPALNGREW